MGRAGTGLDPSAVDRTGVNGIRGTVKPVPYGVDDPNQRMDVVWHDHTRPQIHTLVLLPQPLPLFVGNRADVVKQDHAIRDATKPFSPVMHADGHGTQPVPAVVVARKAIPFAIRSLHPYLTFEFS
ncbi:MAG: hypothetical protein JW808_03345 [Victivallales bacterium]|nr:hypothetical protein [Victivallales bacterium]